jgi:hypothetical protein
MNWRNKYLYIPNKLYKLTEQNICRYRINYEPPEQICIHIKQILQTTETKYLYVPNKLYELTQQILEVEQLYLQKGRMRFTEGGNKISFMWIKYSRGGTNKKE